MYTNLVLLHFQLTSTSDSSVFNGQRSPRIGPLSRALAPPMAPSTFAGCLVCLSFCHLCILSTNACSVPPRACGPDQYGRAVRQPPARGVDQVHQLAREAHWTVLPQRVHQPRSRLPGEGAWLEIRRIYPRTWRSGLQCLYHDYQAPHTPGKRSGRRQHRG